MDSKNILVSIVMPVYNVENYLTDSINSVVKQHYKNIEIILINDGSTDKSKEICESFEKKDSRIKLYNFENEGLSESRNRGMKLALGEYIYFLDSDDTIEKACIYDSVNIIKENNPDIITFNMKRFGINGNELDSYYYDKYKIEKDFNNINVEEFIEKNGFLDNHAGRFIFKKTFLEQQKAQYEKGILFEDILFNITYIINAKKISIINQSYYHYLRRPQSIMTDTKKTQKRIEDTHFVIEKIKKIKNNNNENKHLVRRINEIISNLKDNMISELATIDVKGKKLKSEMKKLDLHHSEYYIKYRIKKIKIFIKKIKVLFEERK